MMTDKEQKREVLERLIERHEARLRKRLGIRERVAREVALHECRKELAELSKKSS